MKLLAAKQAQREREREWGEKTEGKKERNVGIREMGIYRVFGSCKTCFTRKPSLVVELGNTTNKNLLLLN